MIYITQLIYINKGKESVFHQFEELVIPAIPHHNGRLLLRIRPGSEAFIEHSIDQPYEIHLVEFDSEQDFEDFKQDKTRQSFLHLKQESVKASILLRGTKS